MWSEQGEFSIRVVGASFWVLLCFDCEKVIQFYNAMYTLTFSEVKQFLVSWWSDPRADVQGRLNLVRTCLWLQGCSRQPDAILCLRKLGPSLLLPLRKYQRVLRKSIRYVELLMLEEMGGHVWWDGPKTLAYPSRACMPSLRASDRFKHCRVRRGELGRAGPGRMEPAMENEACVWDS